jgi:hypothetical protein
MLGQNVTGTIVGQRNGFVWSVVSGAAVSVVNEGTNIEYKACQFGPQEYVVANLPPGTTHI